LNLKLTLLCAVFLVVGLILLLFADTLISVMVKRSYQGNDWVSRFYRNFYSGSTSRVILRVVGGAFAAFSIIVLLYRLRIPP